MRFIGSKKLLLKDIEYVISKNIPRWLKLNSFCDMFSGTTYVSMHFKKYFKIISNDLLYFSYVMQKAHVSINNEPKFTQLSKIGVKDPFIFLNSILHKVNNFEKKIIKNKQKVNINFVYENFSEKGKYKRKYLTGSNGLKIDLIRRQINSWKEKCKINTDEYFYLLCSLIESIPFVSNIAGTYGAYLKNWDKRSFKELNLEKPEIFNNKKKNLSFNQNANILIKKISGDILYLDPPYNSRQYLPNYHLLETVAKYDYPILKGKTGIRKYNKEKSDFCIKSKIVSSLIELIKNANFRYIILSYNNEGLIKEKELEKILKKFAVNNSFKKYTCKYRRYKKDKKVYKKQLYENIFFLKKK